MFQLLPGGHCFICSPHRDFIENMDEHHKKHWEANEFVPTPCTDACKDSKYKL